MPESPPIYAAQPSVTIDGENEPAVARGVLSLMVAESTEGLYRCETVIGNWGGERGSLGFAYSDRRLLDFGKALTISIGAGDRAGKIFEGRVTGLESHFPQTRAPEIAVLAEDRLQDMRMTRRTRTFDDMSDEDVIGRIASDHGLTADLDIQGPTHAVLAQVNQSDLAFLRERARAVDAELWVDGDTLRAATRTRRGDAAVKLTYGANLHEASVLADLALQRTSVTVAGWDVAAKDGIAHEAGASTVQPELNGHDGGPALLESAFGARKESVVHTVPLTAAEAQARAEAMMRAASRRFVTARGVAEGDARLRVGGIVELVGLDDLFAGEYHLTETRHTFDLEHGYRTHFRAERPGLGRPS